MLGVDRRTRPTGFSGVVAFLDEIIGRWPLPMAAFMSVINTGFCWAFVELVLITHEETEVFFTADASPDSGILFLLGIIYSIDFGVKYVNAIQASANLECNDDLFTLANRNMIDGGKYNALPPRNANDINHPMNADIQYFSSIRLYPQENIMFLSVNKAQSAYLGKTILNYKEENTIRWYLVLLVFLLHTFITPLFLIGNNDAYHIALSCLVRSFMSYFMICLLFQTTYKSEQIVRRTCVPYVEELKRVVGIRKIK
jgi:hypothetical protein